MNIIKKVYLKKDQGCIGVELNKEKLDKINYNIYSHIQLLKILLFILGFCMLLKSNETCLYATKDLVLARKKFDKYNVNQSIYVVDSS